MPPSVAGAQYGALGRATGFEFVLYSAGKQN